MTAGATACTRMPRVATSLASAFVSPMTPAFAAEYGTSVGSPSFPAIEAMLMMRPPPAASITRTAARETRNTLVRSPAMTRCQSSSLSSQVGTVRPVMPALLTTRSEEHTSELQSRLHLVCRLLLEKKKKTGRNTKYHQQVGSA